VVGIAVGDLDLLRCDSQFVGDDLGERGAQTLPVRRGADAGFHETRRVHGELDGFPARRNLHAARREGWRAVSGAL